MGKSKQGGGIFDSITNFFSRGAQATKKVVVDAVPSAATPLDGDKLSAAMGTQPQGSTNIVGGRRTRKQKKGSKKTHKRR